MGSSRLGRDSQSLEVSRSASNPGTAICQLCELATLLCFLEQVSSLMVLVGKALQSRAGLKSLSGPLSFPQDRPNYLQAPSRCCPPGTWWQSEQAIVGALLRRGQVVTLLRL